MNGAATAETLDVQTSAQPDAAPAHTAVRELKRGAIFNTIALLASNFRGLFTFLIAWLLGAGALGTFSIAWATLDLVSKIGIFGLDNAIVTFVARREAAHDHSGARSVFFVSVVLAVLQSALVASAVAIAALWFGGPLGFTPNIAHAVAMTLCALPGVALYRMSTAASRSMKIMQHDIFSRGLTEPFVTVAGLLVAYAIGARVFAPQYAAIAGTAASGVVAFFLAAKLFRRGNVSLPTRNAETARQLLAYAAPISAYQFLNVAITRLDVIMLGGFIGRAPGVTIATVGIYAAVVEVAGGLRKVNQAFNPMFAPIVARMTAQGDHSAATATYEKLGEWMLWILLPVASVMALAGSTIMQLYGNAFRAGGLWLGIVAAACATNAFVALGETVIMVQRPRLNLVHSIITAVVAVIANLLLIPRYGIFGAALGILLPYLLQGVLRHLALRRVFGWPIHFTAFWRPVASAVAALGPAIAVRLNVAGGLGETCAAIVFLVLFGCGWLMRRGQVPALFRARAS